MGRIVSRAGRFMSRLRRARAGCSSAGGSERAGAVRASGRAGRDQRVAGPQASREDRPRGRRVAAPAALRGAAAGGVVARPSMCASGVRARGCATRCCRAHQWIQRIRATLYHHGVARRPGRSAHPRRPRVPRRAGPAARRAQSGSGSRWRSSTCSSIQLSGIERDLRALARRQVGCRALMGQYGIGRAHPHWSPWSSSATSRGCTPRARPSGWPGWKCGHQTAPSVAAILVREMWLELATRCRHSCSIAGLNAIRSRLARSRLASSLLCEIQS